MLRIKVKRESDNRCGIIEYYNRFYNIVITQVGENRYILKACSQTLKLLSPSMQVLVESLNKACSLPQAWKIIGKHIKEQINEQEKYIIEPGQLLDDLAAVGISNMVSYSDKKLIVRSDKRLINFHFKEAIEG